MIDQDDGQTETTQGACSMYSIVMLLAVCLFMVGCTVRPQASGTYHGTSGSSGGDASGSLMFSHPF